VPVELGNAAFLVSWRNSVGTGKLDLHGKIGKPSEVAIQVRRSGGSKALVTEHLSLPAGSFSVSLKLSPGLLGDGQPLLPGGFVVTVDGHSGKLVVPTQVKSVSLPPPPQGIVFRAFASGSAGGRPAGSLHGRSAYAHFVFQSQPSAKTPITVAWYAPGGKLIGVATKSNTPEIDSSISSAQLLPKGTWRVDLRDGSTVVKSLTIVVQ